MTDFKRYYKGIAVGADAGVHELVFDEFTSREKNLNVSILVLGAGHGAFEKRLHDHGYTNTTSVDIKDNLEQSLNRCIIRDLNKDFDDIGKYDYIFCIEVIEHLENQYHFVRNLAKIMKEKTILFITTPNIACKSARLRYLFRNSIYAFTLKDLKGSGHISPIMEHLLLWNLGNSGLAVIKKAYNRKYLSLYYFRQCQSVSKMFIMRKLAMLAMMPILWMLPGDDGVVNMYVISRMDASK